MTFGRPAKVGAKGISAVQSVVSVGAEKPPFANCSYRLLEGCYPGFEGSYLKKRGSYLIFSTSYPIRQVENRRATPSSEIAHRQAPEKPN